MGGIEDAVDIKGQHTMEGGAVRTSHIQEKRHEGSLGSEAPASTPTTGGLWSRTTSI